MTKFEGDLISFGDIPSCEKDLDIINSINYFKRHSFDKPWCSSTIPIGSRFEGLPFLSALCPDSFTEDEIHADSLPPCDSESSCGTNESLSTKGFPSTPCSTELEPVHVETTILLKPQHTENVLQETIKSTTINPPNEKSKTEQPKEVNPTNPEEPAPLKTAPIKTAPKSWASAVKKTPNNKSTVVVSALANPISSIKDTPTYTKVKGRRPETLLELLDDVKIFMKPAPLPIRGITNNNLLCYAHSILQGLIHCSPFSNLLKMIAPVASSSKEDTPILSTLLEFMEEFKVVRDRGFRSKREQDPIEPKIIINLVRSLSDRFNTQLGHQEDAHEFLLALLNGLSDEFLSLFQKNSFTMGSSLITNKDSMVHIFRTDPPPSEEEGGEWVGVGAKNKQFIAREHKSPQTPITALFSGRYQNTVRVDGQKPSVNSDSSICLQIEIEPDHIDNVEDALEHLLKPESLDEYSSDEGGVHTTATKQFSFVTLPPVLVLHLKNVNYSPDDGLVKVLKKIECPLQLNFPSPRLKTPPSRPASYKLTSVIYHHGLQAKAGHYTCDVRRSDDTWLYCNDDEIEKLDANLVGTSDHTGGGFPYVLFYTRV